MTSELGYSIKALPMIEYCEKWFFSRKNPIKPIAREIAEKRHSNSQNYCAVIGGFENPSTIISLAGNWVSVFFLNDAKCVYLSYDFKLEKKRLFLSMAIYREYDGGTEDLVNSYSFSFSVEGKVFITVDNQGEVSDTENETSLSNNWDEYPVFGEYESLCDETRISNQVI